MYGPIVGPSYTVPPSMTPPPITNTPSPTLSSLTPTTGTPTFTPTLSGTPLPTLRGELMGIQINSDLSDQDFDLSLQFTKKLGIKWIKLQFVWDILQPDPGTLSQTFYRYRLFVQRAKQEGFNVMISVAKAPDWARTSLEEDGPPRDPQLLADFFTLLLSEIRVDLYGRSYIDAIEIWNEPNLRREWNGGTLSGADYMRYFDAAYHAIRAGEGGSGIIIVTAGLAPTGVDDGVNAVNDRTYLRQMYEAGLNNTTYQNIAIGMHPYGSWNAPDARCCQDSGQGYDETPDFYFLNNIEDYHAIMLEFGDTSRQLWATEFGWATYQGLIVGEGTPAPAPVSAPWFTYLDQQDQANYIVRAFEIGQSLPYMGPMILWNLNFGGTAFVEMADPRAGYAILGNAVDPRRPAYYLLEQVPKITPTATP